VFYLYHRRSSAERSTPVLVLCAVDVCGQNTNTIYYNEIHILPHKLCRYQKDQQWQKFEVVFEETGERKLLP